MKTEKEGTLTRFGGSKRTVVLDIETVALDAANDKGALDAMTGRIVCIGMLTDDGEMITAVMLADEDEHRLITEFWRTIVPSDVIVGHAVLNFDIRFLLQRSWILGIKPSRMVDTRKFYSGDVIDTLELWANWSGNKRGVTLDALGKALGCGTKTGKGANVARWWAERDLESIKAYCQQDVRIAYQIFCRLTYREPNQFASEVQSVSVGLARTDITDVAEEDVCRA